MTNFFKNLFSIRIDPLEDYTSILERIVKWILIALVAAGAPAVTIGIIEAIQLNQLQSALFYLTFFLPVVILLIIRKMISYKVSAFIIVTFIFLLGLQNTVVYGFSGAGIPLFLTFFMLVTIFYGFKTGLLSIIAGVACIVTIGYLMVTEKISVQVDLMYITTLPVSWLTATSTLVFLGLLMVLSYSFIHFNLLHAIRVAKWHAEKLNKANTELILEIEKKEIIQNQLKTAKEKAEESDRLKSAFLANMSHEIRTPMNGILGFTNLLQEQDLTGEQRKEYIDIIKKSGDRMMNTVNDLIDISRIETGQVDINVEDVKIIEEVQTLFNFFKTEARQKGLEFTLENNLPPDHNSLQTDKNKFISILSNLIKNAIKYTDDGYVKIGLQRIDNNFHFYVKDSGIGVPEDRQEAIFNRFEQADVKDIRAFQGSGLGLAIIKAYVKMLKGKVGVESEEGKGSVFWVKLPFKKEVYDSPKKDDSKKKGTP
jgi:signal transduction histidine kinase